jgi:hypothetical protein
VNAYPPAGFGECDRDDLTPEGAIRLKLGIALSALRTMRATNERLREENVLLRAVCIRLRRECTDHSSKL